MWVTELCYSELCEKNSDGISARVTEHKVDWTNKSRHRRRRILLLCLYRSDPSGAERTSPLIRVATDLCGLSRGESRKRKPHERDTEDINSDGATHAEVR